MEQLAEESVQRIATVNDPSDHPGNVAQDIPVVKEVKDEPKVGVFVGQCKWFNDRYGYGFITVTQGEQKGRDIFVHHSGVKPLNSIYRTLKKGEYINFNIITGENGPQAIDVTGIGGGCLMCDVLPTPRQSPVTMGDRAVARSYTPSQGFQNHGGRGRGNGITQRHRTFKPMN
jgi:cold shock protein